jgi:hypothetical protein
MSVRVDAARHDVHTLCVDDFGAARRRDCAWRRDGFDQTAVDEDICRARFIVVDDGTALLLYGLVMVVPANQNAGVRYVFWCTHAVHALKKAQWTRRCLHTHRDAPG